MANITRTFVDSTKKPGMYADEKLTGFRLKVTESGSKVFLVYGKVKGDPRPIKVTIGRQGERLPDGTVWTADKAREEAQRIRGYMLAGVNPNEEEKIERKERRMRRSTEAERDSITLGRVFGEYSQRDDLQKNTIYVYGCLVRAELSDWIDKPLADITLRDCVDRFRKVKADHSANHAAHVGRLAKAIWNYAMAKYPEAVTSNPWVKAKIELGKGWTKSTVREHDALIEDYQLQAWYEAVQALSAETVKDYLMLLIFTGLRKEAAAEIEWKDIDTEAGYLIAQAKNQRYTGRPHILPVSGYLKDLLARRRNSCQLSSRYVFPGLGRSECLGDIRHYTKQVEERSGCRFTLHTLRKTFITCAEKLDLPHYAVKRLANHAIPNDVTATHYLKSGAERLREPMRLVSEHLQKHMGIIPSDIDTAREGRPGARKTSKAPQAARVLALKQRKA